MKMPLKFIKSRKKFFLAAAFILAAVYVFGQFYRVTFPKTKTQLAVYDTITHTLQARGHIIRKEVPITLPDSSGIVHRVIYDGERTCSGGVIVKIYEDKKDIDTTEKINALTREIEELEEQAHYKPSSPEITLKQVCQQIDLLTQCVNNSQYSELTERKSQITSALNKRQMSIGKPPDFSSKILELKSERDKLLSLAKKSIKDVTSPYAGTFVYNIDGYENSLNYAYAASLMPSDLKSPIPMQEQQGNNLVIGKVICEPKWYIAFVLDSSLVNSLKEGSEITVSILCADQHKIPAHIVSINKQENTSEVAVVCECDYMTPNLSRIRNEDIIINVEEYEGIKIPKTALHEETVKKYDDPKSEKRVKGVFVLYGQELIFKEVIPIYSDENYVICQRNPDVEKLFSGESIKLYDRVVVSGMNMYEGKIIK